MKLTQQIRTAAMLLMLVPVGLAVSACEEEGPAERAGESIDNAVENAGEAIEDTGDAIKDATN